MNIKFNKLYIQQIAYTDFYDGAQLFTWKTFESLPPAYRGKLGISTFAENYNNLQHVKRGLEIEVLEMICLWEA